jgi:uncharacterized OsmC-like protein
MSLLHTTTRRAGPTAGPPDSAPAVREREADLASRDALFVLPERGGRLRASIRGHFLELAEPDSGHRLAPTPDDLFVASIASDLAWSARHFFRRHGRRADVSVSATWQTLGDPPSLADIEVAVAVPESEQRASEGFTATLEERLASRSLDDLVSIRVRWQA